MGQIKKLVPLATRNKLVTSAEKHLPEGSMRRAHLADAVTLSGGALVVAGAVADAKGHKKLGTIVRCVGELADDIDGDISRRLGTASDTGAMLDAGTDKLKIAVQVATMYRRGRENPGTMQDRRKRLGVIAAKHSANAAMNLYMESMDIPTASSEAGKANAWADGAAIGLYSLADIAPKRSALKAGLELAGNIAFGVGLVTGGLAISGYAKQISQHTPAEILEQQ